MDFKAPAELEHALERVEDWGPENRPSSWLIRSLLSEEFGGLPGGQGINLPEG
jgi:hypothetical protein